MWNIFGDGPIAWSDTSDAGFFTRTGDPLVQQQHTLCTQTDLEVFSPEKGSSTREAKTVYHSCEIREECLEYALTNNERFGVWGGLSEHERRRLRCSAG